jgi:hypothetical protein
MAKGDRKGVAAWRQVASAIKSETPEAAAEPDRIGLEGFG